MRLIGLAVVLTLNLALLPLAAEAQKLDMPGSQPEAYRIGPEDVLRIAVWKNDAMSRSVVVRQDGKISLPLVNDVQAAGLTALELRDVLTTKLKEFMPSLEVSVVVAEVRSLKVSVIGEVSRPGRYELKSWATVLDALALAGCSPGVVRRDDWLRALVRLGIAREFTAAECKRIVANLFDEAIRNRALLVDSPTCFCGL